MLMVAANFVSAGIMDIVSVGLQKVHANTELI